MHMKSSYVDCRCCKSGLNPIHSIKRVGLVKNMVESMTAANGAGIAAPQIGESWRVFVVHGTGTNPRYRYKPAVPLTVFLTM